MNPAKLDKRLTFQVKDENAKGPDGDPIDGYKRCFYRMGLFCLFKREGNTLRQQLLIVRFKEKQKSEIGMM
ncbi:hypothetical protein [Bacillus phage FI_KG-Lek]|nr:hypothetical protein [Bacillus phage FI_KG-Lek]